MRMWLRKLCGFSVVAACITLAGCGAPVMTTDDVVVASNQPARFVVSIDRQFGKASVPGADVDFFVNGKKVGSARTDSNGVAALRAPVDGSSSSYTVHARIGNETIRGQGRVFNWNMGRTAVAIDLDETLCATDYFQLFMTDLDTSSRPLEHSPAAVRAMAPHYEIVYLSARPRWLHEKTRVWLDQNGFPPGPILHAARFEACFHQERYKREMLAEFQREFPNLLVGIGDKGVDERAYGDNHMLAVILGKSPSKYQEHCIVLPGWRQIGEFFVEHRDSLSNVSGLQQTIHANGRRLRTYFENGSRLAAGSAVPDASTASTSPKRVTSPAKTQRSAADERNADRNGRSASAATGSTGTNRAG